MNAAAVYSTVNAIKMFRAGLATHLHFLLVVCSCRERPDVINPDGSSTQQ